MNILQRLIVKQVWKRKTVWDGFIKCAASELNRSRSRSCCSCPVQLRLLKAEDLRNLISTSRVSLNQRIARVKAIINALNADAEADAAEKEKNEVSGGYRPEQ